MFRKLKLSGIVMDIIYQTERILAMEIVGNQESIQDLITIAKEKTVILICAFLATVSTMSISQFRR